MGSSRSSLVLLLEALNQRVNLGKDDLEQESDMVALELAQLNKASLMKSGRLPKLSQHGAGRHFGRTAPTNSPGRFCSRICNTCR